MNLKDKVRARAQRDKADAKKAAAKKRKTDEAEHSAERVHAKETIISALEDVGLEELTASLTFLHERIYVPYGGGESQSEGFVFVSEYPGLPDLCLRSHVGTVYAGWDDQAEGHIVGPGIHEWIVKKIGE